MAVNDRIILGIDPGTLVMGYGLLHIQNNVLKPIGIGVIKLDKGRVNFFRENKLQCPLELFGERLVRKEKNE